MKAFSQLNSRTPLLYGKVGALLVDSSAFAFSQLNALGGLLPNIRHSRQRGIRSNPFKFKAGLKPSLTHLTNPAPCGVRRIWGLYF